MKELIQRAHKFIRPYRIDSGDSFRLKDFDPNDRGEFRAADKPQAQEALRDGIEAIRVLQDRLYAQDRWSLLLIFQAIDGAGKDGAIKHVMSGVNPQGCQVHAFKSPSAEDLDHDYMWRCMKALPERGRIGIFNRSYYEEVVVVRVHDEFLGKQKVPPKLLDKKGLWKERCRDIRHIESYLAHNGTIVRKFFLNVSKGEQEKRFRERLENPKKTWKFSATDLEERKYWKAYQEAFEDMIRWTATPESPWFVIPADNKWYTRVLVAAVIVDALASLKLEYPAISKAQAADITRFRRQLGMPAARKAG